MTISTKRTRDACASRSVEKSDENTTIASEPLKVLAVDDSPISRKLLEYSLSGERYSVVFARNGREAIDVFPKHLPAVLITDWDMPDVSGLELCRRIRREFGQSHTYVILLSSNAEKEQVIQGLAAGADDYLTKPFHSGELVARVEVGRRLVELHRQIKAQNQLLKEMAVTDTLTGLPNRRAVELWAPRQLSAAARHDFPVWIVMVDVDFFKKVNDTFGHNAGDTVLKRFAEILRRNTRQSNMCARWGGEEFLLMMTHATKENAETAVDRIRKQLQATEFVFDLGTISVTASFGLSGCQGSEPADLNALIACADAALYAAKTKGRNRIEFAPYA
jgi:two-component system, cell cycle response regulator